jgi:NitT/TauT family transport system permease protein
MTVERHVVDDRTAFLRRPDHRAVRVLALAGLLVCWELVTRTGLVSSLFLPSPIGVLAEGWDMAVSGQLHVHLLTSLERLAWGFAVGALAGISVGVAVGFFSLADAVVQPIIAATFPIPKIALLPLLIRAAVSFGAGRWSVIRKVILPSALPMVFAGLRLGAGIALLLLVAAEQIAADAGIGFLILQSGNLMETTKLMVGIVVLSLLGVLSHWALGGLERAVIRWRHT